MRLNLEGYSGAGPRGDASPLLRRGRRDRADEPDRERLQQGALPGAADQPGAQQRGVEFPLLVCIGFSICLWTWFVINLIEFM